VTRKTDKVNWEMTESLLGDGGLVSGNCERLPIKDDGKIQLEPFPRHMMFVGLPEGPENPVVVTERQ